MSKPRVRTSTGAKVQLTIELTGLGSWGPDCKLEQVYDQAREAAINRISKALATKDGQRATDARIIGPVVVTAITTDMERRG
jgi:hypothetical protein